MDLTFGAAGDGVRKYWTWFLAIGICLLALGILAIALEFYATIATVAALGAIVAIAGIAQIVGAFRAHGAGHMFLYLLAGVLDVIVGAILLSHPLAGALVVTLLLSAMFLVGGIFRFVSALIVRSPHYVWAAVSGIISIILGVLLWAQWPVSALWFIGFCIGLNFVFLGASWIALAARLRAANRIAT
ncbi:MAG: HdeD family acid-resistance protein [Candidatus Baltobacteraceae bacterium]